MAEERHTEIRKHSNTKTAPEREELALGSLRNILIESARIAPVLEAMADMRTTYSYTLQLSGVSQTNLNLSIAISRPKVWHQVLALCGVQKKLYGTHSYVFGLRVKPAQLDV